MKLTSMRSIALISFLIILTQCGVKKESPNGNNSSGAKELPKGDSDNGGLVVPDGFEVLTVADSIGSARHMAVSDNGDIYVKLKGGKPKGIVALRVGADGKANEVKYFGNYDDQGNYGTAVRIHHGYLYFSTAGEVYRIKMEPGKLVQDGKPELIVFDDYRHDKHGFEHIAKPIALDEAGNLYVPFGSPGDVCQKRNRVPGEPGEDPCSQLEEHGGIWKFDANKPNQTRDKEGKRYATGIRSIVAMDWNKADSTLYVVAHGRDDLASRNPEQFTRWQSAIFPSEEFLKVKEGANGGWPYYYYDQVKGKRMLNPEYGGDGKKEGKGAEYLQPLIGFPAHWAPNDLFFYTGDQFPARYKNGAFIAFHGSTNRAPYPQAGYFVAFVPFVNGKPSGNWEVFADGFVGEKPIADVSDAPYRPMAIAMGPDGSLYLSETVKGKIWRVMFKGGKNNFGEGNLAKMKEREKLPHIKSPDEINDNLQKDQLAGGEKLYNTYCAPCHQSNGKGAVGRFPPLENSPYVNRSNKKLITIVIKGLEGNITVNGTEYNDVMPQQGFLTDEQIADVLTYVRRSFGNSGRAIKVDTVRAVRSKLK